MLGVEARVTVALFTAAAVVVVVVLRVRQDRAVRAVAVEVLQALQVKAAGPGQQGAVPGLRIPRRPGATSTTKPGCKPVLPLWRVPAYGRKG